MSAGNAVRLAAAAALAGLVGLCATFARDWPARLVAPGAFPLGLAAIYFAGRGGYRNPWN